jgi:hypothetical protein
MNFTRVCMRILNCINVSVFENVNVCVCIT